MGRATEGESRQLKGVPKVHVFDGVILPGTMSSECRHVVRDFGGCRAGVLSLYTAQQAAMGF